MGKSLARRLGLKRKKADAGLDTVIPAEIKDDAFADWIRRAAQVPAIKTMIEIGSSGGDGSTKAFCDAIAERSDKDEVQFFCMEVSSVRFAKLKAYADGFSFAKPYNVSSVALNEFPSKDDVAAFHATGRTKFSELGLERVQGWLQQDIDYVEGTGRDFNGIRAIKDRHGIETFDLALIDGSEFTGEKELEYLIGSQIILLDDTETFKCRAAFERLEADDRYKLVAHEPGHRNGFAVFAQAGLF